MKTKAKIAIFLVAVMASLAGFSMLVSPSAVALAKAGQLNGYTVEVFATAKTGPETPAIVRINGMP